MKTKYTLRNGRTIEISYSPFNLRVDEYPLSGDEKWVTLEDKSGNDHKCVINGEGVIQTGHYKGTKVGSSLSKQQEELDKIVDKIKKAKGYKTLKKWVDALPNGCGYYEKHNGKLITYQFDKDKHSLVKYEDGHKVKGEQIGIEQMLQNAPKIELLAKPDTMRSVNIREIEQSSAKDALEQALPDTTLTCNGVVVKKHYDGTITGDKDAFVGSSGKVSATIGAGDNYSFDTPKIPFKETVQENREDKVNEIYPYGSEEWYKRQLSIDNGNRLSYDLPVGSKAESFGTVKTKTNDGWKANDEIGSDIIRIDKLLKVGHWQPPKFDYQVNKTVHNASGGSMSPKEYMDYVNGNGGHLTEDECRKIQEAVHSYSMSGYKRLKAYEKVGTDNSAKEMYQSLHLAMAQAPKVSGTLYRYTSIPRSKLADILQGKEFEMGEISSFSYNDDFHNSYAFYQKPTEMMASVQYVTDNGNHNAVDVSMFSGQDENEREVIMPSNTKFKPVSVETKYVDYSTDAPNGGVCYVIHVQEIDNKQ